MYVFVCLFDRVYVSKAAFDALFGKPVPDSMTDPIVNIGIKGSDLVFMAR
jgi:hypothetical protein